jgi:putative hydrolase of the HAD superfamily
MPTNPPVRAVLFGFFGTLVAFEPDRLDPDYAKTALLLHQWGYENAGERFAEVWSAVLRTLELTTSGSLEEFSMVDVLLAYDDTEQLGLTADRRNELLASFMAEWRVGVRPIDGVSEMLSALDARVHVGIVSNTHQSTLVPSLIAQFGLGAVFDPMVLSIVHGHRKPHATIYDAALDGLRQRQGGFEGTVLDPAEVLFVGDTYAPDYAGPLAAGFQARLLDPHHQFDIPSTHRLHSILDLIDEIDAA